MIAHAVVLFSKLRILDAKLLSALLRLFTLLHETTSLSSSISRPIIELQKNNTTMRTMTQTYIRRAHHAGSWYSNDPKTLDDILTKYLADAHEDIVTSSASASASSTSSNSSSTEGCPNACISPHAGYLYSGPTAAYVYLALKEALRSNPHLRTVVVVSEVLCFLNE